MSWPALLGLAAGCYALKATGPLSLRTRSVPPQAQRILGLTAVALLAALTTVQTLSRGKAVTVDARALGLLVAAVLVVRRAPFLFVVVAAAATAALVRLVA